MTISKYGKTYSQSDGSEQTFDGARDQRPGAQRGGQIGRERWADDGGPANDGAVAAPAPRPPWSVLSARDLDAAVRRERPEDASQDGVETDRAARRAADAQVRAADRDAEAARARNAPYRNAWENT